MSSSFSSASSPSPSPSPSPPRPSVAVVMPFAGTPAQASAALALLDGLALRDGDIVVLADNSGTAPPDDPRVRRVPGERSPAHARNGGASAAPGPDWLLFLDADAAPTPELLDAYFASPIADDVGAVAGGVRGACDPGATIPARYGAARNFLDNDAHLRHPFRPRVASANLLVRRAAFDAVGGFAEGIRAAEDTDFSWRLQEAGWTLAVRPDAWAAHAYRSTLRGLRAQWRGYAAGRAWLSRRYPAYTPQPALRRAVARRRRLAVSEPAPPLAVSGDPAPAPTAADDPAPPLPAAVGAAIDVLLGVEELIGLLAPNRARDAATRPPARAVLVTERRSLADEAIPGGVRIEAAVRPLAAPGGVWIDAREDDGALERLLAAGRLALAQPRAVLRDRSAGGPPLHALAPAALRLRADGPGVTVTATADAASAALAARLRRLSGRRP